MAFFTALAKNPERVMWCASAHASICCTKFDGKLTFSRTGRVSIRYHRGEHKRDTTQVTPCMKWLNSNKPVSHEHAFFWANARKRKGFSKVFDEHWLGEVIYRLGSYQKSKYFLKAKSQGSTASFIQAGISR